METIIWQLVVVIAAFFVSAALAPKPPVPAAAVLEDFEIPQFEEGTPHTVVFGTVWLDSWMVIYYGNLRTEPITKDDGGK